MSRFRDAIDIPIWVKLTGQSGNVTELVKGARDGGADAVTLAGRFMASVPDVGDDAPCARNTCRLWRTLGSTHHVRVDAFQKQHDDSHIAVRWHIAFLEVDVSALLRHGHTDQGLQRLQQAVALLDCAGIAWETPDPISLRQSSLAKAALVARPEEAVKAFEAALERRPARLLSLRGWRARTWSSETDEITRYYYRRLADQLRNADHADAVLAEAKRFLDRP